MMFHIGHKTKQDSACQTVSYSLCSYIATKLITKLINNALQYQPHKKTTLKLVYVLLEYICISVNTLVVCHLLLSIIL